MTRKYKSFRIEVNLARKGAEEPNWHYLMEDEYTACDFDNETDARAVMKDEERGTENARLVGFTINGIGHPLP